jgi:V/A-type H+-transporting ATPase subunit F
MKIAMIGGKTSTMGFRALGVDTFEVLKPADAPSSWRQMKLEDYAVVFVTEPVYQVLKQDIEALPLAGLPIVTVIPSVAGSKGTGYDNVRRLVERAVGTDVMARE